MTDLQFDLIVEEAIRLLPDRISRAIENLAVIVEDRPTLEDLDELGLSRDQLLFGIFRGSPISERSFFDPQGRLPNQIILFKEELEDGCPTEEILQREIIMTLVHEVGHYLGLGERELRELEAQAGG